MTFASAASRIAQVLITTRSAASIDGASAQPAASSRPAISSESLLFIWQPSVQTKNDGQGARLGPELLEALVLGRERRRAARPARLTGGAMSRTGRLRVVMTLVMVVPVAVASAKGRAPLPSASWNCSPTPRRGSPCSP